MKPRIAEEGYVNTYYQKAYDDEKSKRSPEEEYVNTYYQKLYNDDVSKQ